MACRPTETGIESDGGGGWFQRASGAACCRYFAEIVYRLRLLTPNDLVFGMKVLQWAKSSTHSGDQRRLRGASVLILKPLRDMSTKRIVDDQLGLEEIIDLSVIDRAVFMSQDISESNGSNERIHRRLLDDSVLTE